MNSDEKGGSVATKQQLHGEGSSFHTSHNRLIKSKPQDPTLAEWGRMSHQISLSLCSILCQRRKTISHSHKAAQRRKSSELFEKHKAWCKGCGLGLHSDPTPAVRWGHLLAGLLPQGPHTVHLRATIWASVTFSFSESNTEGSTDIFTLPCVK